MERVTDENGVPLSASEVAIWEDDLSRSSAFRVLVEILNRNGNVVSSLSVPGDERALAGGVAVDDAAPISRTLSLDLYDPDRKIVLDPASASSSSVYADNEISVRRDDWSPTLGKWGCVRPFTGPLSGLDRDGDVVHIGADSKERYGIKPAVFWRPFHRRKGTKKTELIKDVLAVKGETAKHFRIPDLGGRIPRPVTYGPFQEPWVEAFRVGKALGGRTLEYDGSGFALLHLRSTNPVVEFFEDVDLDAPAKVRPFDLSIVRNVVQVVGGDPRGKRSGQIVAVAAADAKSPLSAQSLARNGAPRFLVERIENTHLRTVRECRDYAEQALSEFLVHEAEVEFDCLVRAHLSPGTPCRLTRTDGTTYTFVARRFTIPLGPGLQTIGSVKRKGMGGTHSSARIHWDPRKKKHRKHGGHKHRKKKR